MRALRSRGHDALEIEDDVPPNYGRRNALQLHRRACPPAIVRARHPGSWGHSPSLKCVGALRPNLWGSLRPTVVEGAAPSNVLGRDLPP